MQEGGHDGGFRADRLGQLDCLPQKVQRLPVRRAVSVTRGRDLQAHQPRLHTGKRGLLPPLPRAPQPHWPAAGGDDLLFPCLPTEFAAALQAQPGALPCVLPGQDESPLHALL